MSQEDVEVVRRAWGASDRGDTEALFALYHPAIVWESHYGPISGAYHGHEGVRQFFREWTDALETFRARAVDFIEVRDRVVVDVRVWARGKGSGAEVEMPQGHLCSVVDGLLTRIELFETKARALEAVGLSEQNAHSDS
jgi:ketosteroid isomerase-like protein